MLQTLLLGSLQSAHALQIVEASDGVSVEAVLSIKEPTRIRIDGAPITNVFGNIYSNNCASVSSASPTQPGSPPPPVVSSGAINPGGEIVLECDSEKGEIYVRPVGGLGKPVNLFISSQHATYTLILRRSDTPADTIVIRDRAPRFARPDSSGAPAPRNPQHVRSLKAMLVAMASDRTPADLRVEEVNRPVRLWQEATFSLIRLYEGRGLIGERYILTNISNQHMVVAEQELDREQGDVLGISIQNHNLRPGESTAVYVIRRGS